MRFVTVPVRQVRAGPPLDSGASNHSWGWLRTRVAGTTIGTVTATVPEGGTEVYDITAGNAALTWAVDALKGSVVVGARLKPGGVAELPPDGAGGRAGGRAVGHGDGDDYGDQRPLRSTRGPDSLRQAQGRPPNDSGAAHHSWSWLRTRVAGTTGGLETPLWRGGEESEPSSERRPGQA